MAHMLARRNNFDVLRLFAALQVLVLHSAQHLDLMNKQDIPSYIYALLSFFPGVPIFFGLSGFLITQTYVRKPAIPQYLRNRALRIFPGLWGCLALTLAILVGFSFVNLGTLSLPLFWAWLAGQLTFFQFYTPPFLRDFGLGNPNGSLWTIVVELQFYILVPVLWYIGKKTTKGFWNAFTALAIVGLIASAVMPRDQSMVDKIAAVTILPYLPFFWLGATICVFQESIMPYLVGKGGWWLLAYLAFSYYFGFTTEQYSISYFPDVFSRLGLGFLIVTCFACVFTKTSLSDKLLKGNDLSYGIYVFHAPLIGAAIEAGLAKNYSTFWAIVAGTLVLAFSSWRLVEKPALAKKKLAQALT